jgi:hypothetical protein
MSFGHHELIAALIESEERDPGNLLRQRIARQGHRLKP